MLFCASVEARFYCSRDLQLQRTNSLVQDALSAKRVLGYIESGEDFILDSFFFPARPAPAPSASLPHGYLADALFILPVVFKCSMQEEMARRRVVAPTCGLNLTHLP